MPQFDPANFAPQIIWLLISFGIFYLLMARLALPRIGEVLEQRSDRIADDLDQAERLKRDADALQAELDQALAQARATAAKALAEARAAAQKDVDQRLAAVEHRLAADASAAEARIAAEKQAALTGLHTVATEACEAIIAKLIGAAPSDGEVAKAVKAALVAEGKGR